MFSPELHDLMFSITTMIEEALSYDDSDEIIPPAPRPRIVDVSSAHYLLGSLEFEHRFGLTPKFACRLALLLFDSEVLISQHRHGSVGGELALLLIMARFRGTTSTIQGIAFDFGYNNGEAKISDLLNLICTFLHNRFEHLLALKNLTRFAPYAQLWGEAMQQKYVDISNDPYIYEFPGSFRGVNCAVDGFRLAVARPTYGQEPFYSG